jgi:hypothetical protein
MPYGYRKAGDKITVFKKDTGKVVGHTTPGKLKAYLAALHMHSKDMREAEVMDPKEKAATLAAVQKDIEAKKLALKNAEDKLKNLKEFKLASFVKSLLEAEGDDEVATTGEDPEADTTGGDTSDTGSDEKDAESKPKASDSLTVKFNMANVKKYNSYPVIDNTGTVTGVSKEGVTVLVGDSSIFVNFEDIL